MIDLILHPKNQSSIVKIRNVQAQITWIRDEVEVEFKIFGDLRALVGFTPSNHIGQRKNELWKSTCFEWFIKPVGQKYYWECNLSPRGDWNVYHLNDYRLDLQEEAKAQPVSFSSNWQDNHGRLVAKISLANLEGSRGRRFHVNLTAVIEDQQGSKTYWSLAHTQPQPDFHHPDHFIYDLTKEL